MEEIMLDYTGKSLPPVIVENLQKSKEGAEKYPMREIKCPICGMHLCNVYGTSSDVFISVKCQKCKTVDVPLSMGLFRTVKKRQTFSFYPGGGYYRNKR